MKKVISVVIFVIMALLTLIRIVLEPQHLFFGVSNAQMKNIVDVNLGISIILLIGFGFILFSLFKSRTKTKIGLLFVVAFFWLLSGRTVGTLIYPDGRISTGWFYFETSRLNACNHKIDCETEIYYETSIEKLAFWRLRIKNESVDEVIFIGPFIWNETLKMFKGTFGSGGYYK